jgi:WD40 repeat protein
MFTGQIAQISNRADWISPFCQLIDESDNSVINILNADIGFDCSVYIRDDDGCYRVIGSISNGKVIISSGDDGPGFQWSFSRDDLHCLRAGTYRFGVKTTANGKQDDLIDGTVAVIEGN